MTSVDPPQPNTLMAYSRAFGAVPGPIFIAFSASGVSFE